MSRLDGKCDNCGADVSPEEGDWWITGHYLCPKCYKKWKERYDNVIKSELDREKMWEEYSKSDEEKIEDKIEAEIEAGIESKKEKEEEKETKKKEIESKKKKHKDLFDFK